MLVNIGSTLVYFFMRDLTKFDSAEQSGFLGYFKNFIC